MDQMDTRGALGAAAGAGGAFVGRALEGSKIASMGLACYPDTQCGRPTPVATFPTVSIKSDSVMGNVCIGGAVVPTRAFPGTAS